MQKISAKDPDPDLENKGVFKIQSKPTEIDLKWKCVWGDAQCGEYTCIHVVKSPHW